MSNGRSEYSGKIGDCIAKEFVVNGLSVSHLILVEEQNTACFTEALTTAVVNFFSEPCTVTTRIEGTC